MPQASDALRAQFPGGCEEALDLLVSSCTITKGLIRPKSKMHLRVFTPRQYAAIDYLFEEWDYAWGPEPAEG